jgi:hypothetical protein
MKSCALKNKMSIELFCDFAKASNCVNQDITTQVKLQQNFFSFHTIIQKSYNPILQDQVCEQYLLVCILILSLQFRLCLCDITSTNFSTSFQQLVLSHSPLTSQETSI